MLYPSRESGVQYKGIRSAPYIIRFINIFMNPIKRVTTDEQLMQLLKSYDVSTRIANAFTHNMFKVNNVSPYFFQQAVMIGYFNFMGLRKSPGYREYYRAALRTLEKDPNGEIAFVAITSPQTAKEHGVVQFPAASLLMWNETLVTPFVFFTLIPIRS